MRQVVTQLYPSRNPKVTTLNPPPPRLVLRPLQELCSSALERYRLGPR